MSIIHGISSLCPIDIKYTHHNTQNTELGLHYVVRYAMKDAACSRISNSTPKDKAINQKIRYMAFDRLNQAKYDLYKSQ
ncbi:MAG: hypothetical protein A2Z36_00815 [Chloroflexi bacterium RBG_19FT_COMBO_48_23]|nr:MAG: hypothetical protein A2Z36_00815 [Chloroflexi bacterium RBG_19FT_COMBO_48_23]